MTISLQRVALLLVVTAISVLVITMLDNQGASRRSRHAQQEWAAPEAWVTLNTSAGQPIRVAPPSEIARCIISKSHRNAVAVSTWPYFRILSLGDSLGREMTEAVLVRFGRPKHRKHADFDQSVTRDGVTVHFMQRYRQRVSLDDLNAVKAHTINASTFVLVSRGAADSVYFGSPLHQYFTEVRTLATALMKVESLGVVWRVLHNGNNRSESWFRPECVTSFAAFRRVAACAVSAAMEDAAANGSSTDRRSPLTLFDATDPIEEHAMLEGDGLHVGRANGAVLMDAVLSHAFCPQRPLVSETAARGAFFGDDAEAIATRYKCDELKRTPGDLWESQVFGFRSRHGCGCYNLNMNVNDQCELHGLHSFSFVVRLYNELSRYFRAYVCKLRVAPNQALMKTLTNISHALWVPSRDLRMSEMWLTEIVLELCVNSAVQIPILMNLGYAPPVRPNMTMNPDEPYGLCTPGDDAVSSLSNGVGNHSQRQATRWCRLRKKRHAWVLSDIQLLWHRVTLSPSPAPPLGRCSKTLNFNKAKVDRNKQERRVDHVLVPEDLNERFLEEFIHGALALVCHPQWPRDMQGNRTAPAVRARRDVLSTMRKSSRVAGSLASKFDVALKEV